MRRCEHITCVIPSIEIEMLDPPGAMVYLMSYLLYKNLNCISPIIRYY